MEKGSGIPQPLTHLVYFWKTVFPTLGLSFYDSYKGQAAGKGLNMSSGDGLLKCPCHSLLLFTEAADSAYVMQ